MKKSLKILSLILGLSIAVGATAGMTAVASAESGVDAAPAAPQASVATIAETKAAAQVYLVPGEGNSLEGTPLTAEETAALHMEGKVYKAGAAGSALPTPTTTKTDRTGASFAFNGWWYIKDATVTYVDVVPAEDEITYLYADFRAALSQHSDPVAPAGDTATSTPEHYMRVVRAETGEVELIPLHVSGTDVSNAVHAKYTGPVQWYNEWFVLYPGDVVSYWFTGIYGSTPMYGPRPRHTPQSCDILLNSSGQYGTTGQYMQFYNDDAALLDDAQQSRKYFTANSLGEAPALSYTGPMATQAYVFRIYIQFYDEGGHMTLYMENLSLKLGVKA